MHREVMGDPKEFVKTFLLKLLNSSGIVDRVVVVPLFTGSNLVDDTLQTYAGLLGVPIADVGPCDRFPGSSRERPSYFIEVERLLDGCCCALLDPSTGCRDRHRGSGNNDENYITYAEIQRLLTAPIGRLLLVYDESYGHAKAPSKSVAVVERVRAICGGVPHSGGFGYFGGGVNVLILANHAALPLLRVVKDKLASLLIGCSERIVG